ncbi:MAG: hypothetical protein ACFCD0_09695 [Gemmataceae bacterium]
MPQCRECSVPITEREAAKGKCPVCKCAIPVSQKRPSDGPVHRRSYYSDRSYRGHNEGVGLDEWVAHEYARVRRLYAELKMSERTEIEFFQGGHEIHGKGTFRFLEKHLNWPR